MNTLSFKTCLRAAGLLLAAALATSCAAPKSDNASAVQRMYAFNCGQVVIKDLSRWSPGYNIGRPFEFSDNCYLIQHGKDMLLWDSGLVDSLTANADGQVMANGAFTLKRSRTLASQMAEIGVTPSQVTQLAFSHYHADHAGNGNMFAGATLYVQQADYDAAFGADAAKNGFTTAYYDKLGAGPVKKLNGDFDVYGDGSVTIISTPGHTAGHQSLMVRLPKRGVVILSGDIAHFEENWLNRRQPAFNYNQDQGKQSMDKVAALMAANHAELWINHDKAQSDKIPHAPAYIE
jgi:N-acyl homoserine lactone hydrolase